MREKDVINEYFDMLYQTLSELNLFNKPDQIWNLDKTSTSTNPSKTKVFGLRGKPSSRLSGRNCKENITWL